MSHDARDLTKKTVKNVAWNYAAFASGKLVTFISTVVLARVLAPDDFGLLAVALLTVNYLDMFSSFGVGDGLIYRKEEPEKTANVAIVISVASSLLLFALAFFGAPLVADFFNEARVVELLRVLALTLIISSFGSIHGAWLKKNLNFRARLLPQLARAVAKGLVSVVMALSGFGVWSLVWGQIAGELTSTALYWYSSKWTPRPTFDWTIGRELTSYGSQIILVGFLGEVYKNVDYIIVGRQMATEQLGYYTLAYRLPELLIINIVSVVSMALFPSYTKIQDDLPALRQGFLMVLRYIAVLTIPIGVGMFVITDDFIRVFYTSKWDDAIPVMRVLAIYAVVFSLSYNAGAIYKATGRPNILNKLALIKLAITIPVLWWAAEYSIYYVALGQLATTIILTLIGFWWIVRIIHVQWGQIAAALRVQSLSALVMLGGLLLLRLPLEGLPPLLRLLLLIPAGVLLYGGSLWLLDRAMLQDAAGLILPKLRKLRARRQPQAAA